MKPNTQRTRRMILPALLAVLAGASLNWAPLRPVQAQGNLWRTKANMPTARQLLAAAAIDGKLYAVGGFRYSGTLNALEVYDPQTNTWETRANMPTARYGLAADAIDGKLYAVGGANGGRLNTLEVYDPQTNTWETLANMPTARSYFDVAAIDGKLYAFGGLGGGAAFNILLNTLEVYDPQTNTWETLANMPTARQLLAAAAIDSKLYAVGGFRYSDTLKALEVYDPQTNTWETLANMPTARYGFAADAIDGKLYAVGGGGNGRSITPVVSGFSVQ